MKKIEEAVGSIPPGLLPHQTTHEHWNHWPRRSRKHGLKLLMQQQKHVLSDHHECLIMFVRCAMCFYFFQNFAERRGKRGRKKSKKKKTVGQLVSNSETRFPPRNATRPVAHWDRRCLSEPPGLVRTNLWRFDSSLVCELSLSFV